MDERLANLSCISNFSLSSPEARVHNASCRVLSEEDLRGDISKNPDLFTYQMVQGVLLLLVVVTGAFKGYLTIYTLVRTLWPPNYSRCF